VSRRGGLPSDGAGEEHKSKDVKEQSYRSRSKQRNGVGEASEQSYRFDVSRSGGLPSDGAGEKHQGKDAGKQNL
jgi:hypothetical protein